MIQLDSTPLVVTNLTKAFSVASAPAVAGISFEIRQGEILGLLGPNGAGKTTTIRMLNSTLKPTAGSIQYFGKNFESNRSWALQQIAFASTYTNLPLFLTVEQNLDVHGRLFGLSFAERKSRSEELLEFFRLNSLRKRRITQLSAGQRTRVMLVKAFLSRPKLALLDEPTASLDPDVAEDVRRFILAQQSEHHLSILYTSHNMSEVTTLCDRVIFLKEGRIVAEDTPENLAASIDCTTLQFAIEDGLKRTVSILGDRSIRYELAERQIRICVPDQEVSQLIAAISNQGVQFTGLTINRPTLEDYFLRMAQ